MDPPHKLPSPALEPLDAICHAATAGTHGPFLEAVRAMDVVCTAVSHSPPTAAAAAAATAAVAAAITAAAPGTVAAATARQAVTVLAKGLHAATATATWAIPSDFGYSHIDGMPTDLFELHQDTMDSHTMVALMGSRLMAEMLGRRGDGAVLLVVDRGDGGWGSGGEANRDPSPESSLVAQSVRKAVAECPGLRVLVIGEDPRVAARLAAKGVDAEAVPIEAAYAAAASAGVVALWVEAAGVTVTDCDGGEGGAHHVVVTVPAGGGLAVAAARSAGVAVSVLAPSYVMGVDSDGGDIGGRVATAALGGRGLGGGRIYTPRTDVLRTSDVEVLVTGVGAVDVAYVPELLRTLYGGGGGEEEAA
ncbi:hypothetical protein MMPV_002840 [Pyropia vietnamensis]